MNSSFRAVTASFKMAPETLTHSQEVCRLYRQSLRLLDSWAADRDLFLDEAEKIREMFDSSSSLDPNSAEVRSLMSTARKILKKYEHPDRYIPPYMPGGSKFMRNPPLPLQVCYPNGIPDEVMKEMGGIEMNLDMTYATEGKKSRAGPLYVDFATKNVY